MERLICEEALEEAGWDVRGLRAVRVVDPSGTNPITLSIQPDGDDSWSVDVAQAKDPGDLGLGEDMVQLPRRFLLMRELDDLLLAISPQR